MDSIELSDDDPAVALKRQKVRKRFRRSFLAVYFIGIMFSLRNKVQICGALRPIEYYEAFESMKPPVPKEEKTSSLVFLY